MRAQLLWCLHACVAALLCACVAVRSAVGGGWRAAGAVAVEVGGEERCMYDHARVQRAVWCEASTVLLTTQPHNTGGGTSTRRCMHADVAHACARVDFFLWLEA